MAQAGYTPISLYYSTTAAAVPVNTNLASGELAINITDGKLYYKDNTGTVKVIAGAGGAGVAGGSNTQVQYNSSGSLAGSVNLTFDGTNLTTGGSETAARFIPSGSTVATNGMYLPAANSLGFSTNSTLSVTIDSTQQLGIGSGTAAGQSIRSAKAITGSVNSYGFINAGIIQSDVTSNAYYFRSSASTAASAFTLTALSHYSTIQGTIGAGSSVTNQYGYYADSTLTGATNNYGFYGNIASGTGRYNLYMAGTADNYIAGAVGIGNTNVTARTLGVSKTITGAVTAYGIVNNGAIQSDVTTNAFYNWVNINTAAAAFTTTNAIAYYANQGTIGASSAITNQYGFLASSALTGGTNNYGFYGDIASGSGRWNFYAAGTAQNYFAGNVGIATTSPGSALDVKGTLRLSGATSGYVGFAPAAAAGSTTYTLPSADGSSGQFLSTNGSGTLSWATGGGGGGSAATPTALGTVYGSMTTSGASPYLTALGYNAGAANTGARNVFIGVSAGQANLAGGDSIAIGYEAMKNYTESNGNNIAIGTQSLSTATSGTSYYNIAIGHEAMKSNTSGYINTAVGWRALFSNTTGRYSTAVGYQALYLLQSGNDGSTAVGANAGSSITTGIYNVMVGGSAIASVTTGGYNTAMGYNALGSAATTSSSNTAFGYNALAAGGVKDNNVAIGRDAMVATSGGANNVAVGREALAQNTTSANNVSVGYQSLYSITNASGSHVAVGYQALYSATDNNNSALGYRAGYGVTSGHNNVLLGSNAGNSTVVLAGGAQNVVIGSGAYTNTTGAYNEIVIGQSCNGVGNDYVTIGKINNRVYNHYDTNATWIQASDVRLKKDIESDSLGLSFINKLRPVKYRWKATNELEHDNPQYSEVNNKNTTVVMHGLIAQEVKAVLDEEGVDTFGGWHIEPNGIQGVSREMFITPLIKAVQELTAQIETLKAEVAALKGNV